MSKLIESLKASAQEFSKRRTETATTSKSQYDLTQEQLADIYFNSGEKTKKTDVPMVIKVIERERQTTSLGPWVISLVAIIITAFSLFSSKRVFVDIKVIDDHAMYQSEWTGEGNRPQSMSTGSRMVLRSLGPQNFQFEGAATLKSSRTKDTLTLSNSSISNFARAYANFEPALNLTTSKITFSVKGAQGGENIGIALKDKNNQMAFTKGKFFPFPTGLTNDWQRVEISAQDLLPEFDERNISSIRFEFGSKDIGNKGGDTLMIKDLQVESL